MNTEQKDERRGHTSASNAAADRLCPGRHLAQRGLSYEVKDDEATQGTLIHAVFAGTEHESVLDKESLVTLKRAQEIESHILGGWLMGLAQDAPATCHREERLFAWRGGRRRHSGQADAFWITADKKHALPEDLKSLSGEHPDADVNEQIRDYDAIS